MYICTVIPVETLASVEVPSTILKTENTKDWVPMKGHQGLGSFEGDRGTNRRGSYAECLGSYDGRMGSYAVPDRSEYRIQPGLKIHYCVCDRNSL